MTGITNNASSTSTVASEAVALSSQSRELEDIIALVQTFLPFIAFMKLPDWLKLAIVGAVLEGARRFILSWWLSFKKTCFISVHFDSQDSSYGASHTLKHTQLSLTNPVHISRLDLHIAWPPTSIPTVPRPRNLHRGQLHNCSRRRVHLYSRRGQAT